MIISTEMVDAAIRTFGAWPFLWDDMRRALQAAASAAPKSEGTWNDAVEACAQVTCGVSDKYSRQARDLWRKPGEGKAAAAETAADEVEAAIRALRRDEETTAPTDADIRGLCASDIACYRWPGADQAALRDAYVQGATDSAPTSDAAHNAAIEAAAKVADESELRHQAGGAASTMADLRPGQPVGGLKHDRLRTDRSVAENARRYPRSGQRL
jgi:hypothetical protein